MSFFLYWPPKTAGPSPTLTDHFRTGAAVGEVAVTEDEGSRSSQPIALIEWRYSGLFLMLLGIVWGNASRCYQQPAENIRLVEWRDSGLFLLPLGIVWGNASRCHQQQGENISPQLSVLEIDIVPAHLNSPVDTEQAHRLVRRGRVMSPDRPEVLKLH